MADAANQSENAVAMGERKFCSACGSALHLSASTCPHCGAQQRGGQRVQDQKSRVAAILLALFLGGIGGHKFYLGKPGIGVLYLIFFWTFIPAVVALIEAVIYITMSDDAFREKYG